MLESLSTSAISDALDRLGINGQLPGILPVGGARSLLGPAFTIAYEPVDAAGGTVGDFIDDVPPECVIVIDNAARRDGTVWGDILTEVAHTRGIQGTVINGVCRDTQLYDDLAYPVFSVSHWMRTGKDRVRMRAVQVPLSIGGVPVSPGDVVKGDRDGALVVPAARVAEVTEVAAEIDRAEEAIRAAVRAGQRLDEARTAHGYFALQTRRNR